MSSWLARSWSWHLNGRIKGRTYRRLDEAIRTAGLNCEAFPDGMAVRVDTDIVYEPDAMVCCGATIDGDAVQVVDSVLVVEVVLVSSHKRDCGSKLEDYFRIPSLRHYLIVKTDNQAIVHHRRDEAGEITTCIIREGAITLDPPGLTVTGYSLSRIATQYDRGMPSTCWPT